MLFEIVGLWLVNKALAEFKTLLSSIFVQNDMLLKAWMHLYC